MRIGSSIASMSTLQDMINQVSTHAHKAKAKLEALDRDNEVGGWVER